MLRLKLKLTINARWIVSRKCWLWCAIPNRTVRFSDWHRDPTPYTSIWVYSRNRVWGATYHSHRSARIGTALDRKFSKIMVGRYTAFGQQTGLIGQNLSKKNFCLGYLIASMNFRKINIAITYRKIDRIHWHKEINWILW